MICFLNRGIILEQAVCTLIEDYLNTIQIDKTFKNFHTHVTLRHPFAHLFMEKGVKAADHFPCVVVAAYDEDKPSEMDGLPAQFQGTGEWDAVGFNKADIDGIFAAAQETVTCNNQQVTQQKPGIPIIASEEAKAAIYAKLSTAESDVFGWAVRTYRHDSISIEIWAENEQVKNQIYSDINLFILGNFRNYIIDKYPYYDLKIDDESIRGQRSSAYNIDFAVILSGANIRFEVNYAIEQILINTELKKLHKEIIIGGNSYA